MRFTEIKNKLNEDSFDPVEQNWKESYPYSLSSALEEALTSYIEWHLDNKQDLSMIKGMTDQIKKGLIDVIKHTSGDEIRYSKTLDDQAIQDRAFSLIDKIENHDDVSVSEVLSQIKDEIAYMDDYGKTYSEFEDTDWQDMKDTPTLSQMRNDPAYYRR